jgi:hypothetical protein
MEFRLLSRRCGKQSGECINLVIGNVSLAPGETISMGLGVGALPSRELRSNGDVVHRTQTYVLTYDERHYLTPLDRRHRLGRVVVRRDGVALDRYIIDLVSHEGALPVWRGVVTVPQGT